MLKSFRLFVSLYFLIILILASETALASDTAKGGELYAVHCAGCHGSDGNNIMPNAPNFSQNEGLIKPDALLFDAITKGGGAMPSYLGMLSNQDILDVIAFLRTLN